MALVPFVGDRFVAMLSSVYRVWPSFHSILNASFDVFDVYFAVVFDADDVFAVERSN